MATSPNSHGSPPLEELLWWSSPQQAKRSSGRPIWLRLATVAIMLYLIGWGLEQMPSEQIRALGTTISPYTTRIALGVGIAAAVLLLVWLPRWLRDRSLARAGMPAGEAAEQMAVADELKITPPTRVQSRVRVWLWWRPPFWRLRKATIWIPRGKVTDDPAPQLARRLEPLLGQVHKVSWKPRWGRLVLAAGPAPQEQTEQDVPEAATDPQERSQEIAKEILHTSKLHSEVLQKNASGEVTSFKLRHPTSIRVASDGAQNLISSRFDKLMPDAPGGRGWGVTIDPQRNEITVKERPKMPDFLPHPVLDYGAEFGKKFLPFGRAEHGGYVGWDVSASTKGPHCLLVGPTGSGKTNTIRSVVVGGTRQSGEGSEQVEVWGLDPKMIELMGLEGWPGVTRLAFVVDEMAELIDAAYDEMMDRYYRIKRREVSSAELPTLLFIVDEFLVLRAQLLRWWKEEQGNKGEPPQMGKLNEMLALARVAAVHIGVGIQRPDASHFDDGARDNLRTRVAHDPLSQQGRQMMWGDASLGILHSHGIRGRAMATDSDFSPVETQMMWTPDLDQHPMARRWMSEQDKALIDGLRPADYTPYTITKEGLCVPDTDTRDVPDGSVQSEMMDQYGEIVRARDLSAGDTIKIDRGGRWETAVVEDNPYQTGDETLDLDIVWDNGGGGDTLAGTDAGEEIYCVAHSDIVATAT